MSSIGSSQPPNNLDRYVVVHVATTCDEHGVYVTKDSAEVIELGWILLDGKTCEEVRGPTLVAPNFTSSSTHFSPQLHTGASPIHSSQFTNWPHLFSPRD
jgi:hypothetical protein